MSTNFDDALTAFLAEIEACKRDTTRDYSLRDLARRFFLPLVGARKVPFGERVYQGHLYAVRDSHHAWRVWRPLVDCILDVTHPGALPCAVYDLGPAEKLK